MASASTGFRITNLKFTDVRGKQQAFPTILNFEYEEDIFLPFTYASLIVNDSTKNLLGTLPIQGGEKLDITISNSDGTFDYTFIVYGISSRTSTERVQIYNLKLISEVALKNESVRPREVFSGKSSEIALKLLSDSEYLGIDKGKIFVEESQFKTKFIADSTKNPFSIINQLALQSVSNKSVFGSPKGSNKSGDKKQSVGTSGYLFYENREGHHFKSVDLLCARKNNDAGFEGQDPAGEYIFTSANKGGENDDEKSKNAIIEYSFDTEIDVLENLRKGTYSSLYCFYNVSTGKYEEYQYSMADTFNSMIKLGNQSKLGKSQIEFSKTPTKIMSKLIDHETWYNENGIASPEDADGGDGSNEITDSAKFYSSQSIARIGILGTYKLTVVIPGNPNLMIGQKIDVKLPNMVPSSEKQSQQFDEENSGTYLISHVQHRFDITSNTAVTQLSLMRDSIGMKDVPSKAK